MKTKHIAVMAAAIAVCSGAALYVPQDTFVGGVLTASAAETVNSNSTMKVHTEDENAFVFHVNDFVDFENKEFYELFNRKLEDVTLLIYDEDSENPNFKYELCSEYDLFNFDMSEVNMAKAGTYPVYVTDKKDSAIRTSFNITVKEWFMKVHTEDENAFVFHVNDLVDFENKEFYEQNLGKLDDVSILIYDENGENPNFKYRLHTDYERFSFDMSEVNMTKAGIYPVYVTDKKDSAIRTSFNITVKEWFMKVHTEDENAFVFHVNDFVDFENKEFYEQNLGNINDVSILIYDENGENPNFKYRLHTDYERFSFDMSEVNMAKAGTYPVYVTDKEDSSIRTSFNITVKEWFMKVHAEDENDFLFHVNDFVDFENKEFYEQNLGKFNDVYILIYDEDGRKPYPNQSLTLSNYYDLFSFDMSEVNMKKAGTYPVYVTDKEDASIRTSFNITVKDWFIKVYTEDENAFVFHVNDFVDFENEEFYEQNFRKFDDVSILVYDEDDRKPYPNQNLTLPKHYDLFSFDMSEVNMAKAGTYPVYVTAKDDASIRTSFNITVKDWFMKVHAEDEEAFVFHVNDPVDFENKEFYIQNLKKIYDVSILIYDENGENPNFKYRLHIDYDRFSFDMSEVNMAKAGIYPVTVIYKENESICCEFDIHVKNLYMEVLKNNEYDFIYYVGESFNESLYYVKIYDDDEVIHSSLPLYFDAIIDTSEVDMNTPGTYTVYATHEDHPSVKCEFEITVKENGEPVTKVYSNRADEFTFNVGDELCLDDFYIMRTSASGNVSIFVYFEHCTVDTSEVDMNTPGTYTIYVSNDTSSISTEFQITVESIETTTTATTTTTTTTTTAATENETPETTTTVTTLPQTGYSSLYNYMMLLATAITTFGGYVMAKARKKFNNN